MLKLNPGLLALPLAAWAALIGCRANENVPKWPVPAEARERPNPVAASPDSLSAGAKLYREHCAICHGVSGDGKSAWAETLPEPPADLTDPAHMKRMTDGEIFWKISTGRDLMPPFAERLREEERWQVVNYLRTLARPHLVALRNVTRETANLVVRDGLDAVYLDQVESQRSLRHSGWSGRAIPIAGTATGAALSGEFGAKVAADAVESGVTAVACRIPIDHAPAAAVSVIGPTFRLRGSILQHVRTEVESAARRIAEDLHRAAEHGPY